MKINSELVLNIYLHVFKGDGVIKSSPPPSTLFVLWENSRGGGVNSHESAMTENVRSIISLSTKLTVT